MHAPRLDDETVTTMTAARRGISGEAIVWDGQLNLLHSALDEIADFVLILDATPPSEGGPYVQYLNGSLAHALRQTPDALVGQPYSAILGPDTNPSVRRGLSAGLERKVRVGNEIKLLRPDGSTFWVEFEATPMVDDRGVLRHWIAVGRDMTVRRRAQDQLSALVNAIDAARDSIEIYEVSAGNFSILFENEAASRRASRTLERLLADPEHSPAAQSLRKRLLDGYAVRRRSEARRHDGEYRVEIDARPLVSLGGGIETVVCIERDISATVMRERELQREIEQGAAFRSALLQMFAATSYEVLYSLFEQAVAENSGGTRLISEHNLKVVPEDARTIEVPQGRYVLRSSGDATLVEAERLEVLTASFISASRSLATDPSR